MPLQKYRGARQWLHVPDAVQKKVATGIKKSYILGMVHFAKRGSQPAPDASALDDLDLTPEQKSSLMQSIAQGEAQYQAGEAIPGAEVLAWIRSWGTERPLPAPARKNPR